MKKTIILAMFAALCTLTAGCADDFKTVLNDKYYEDDTPSREPDITEQTLTLGSYNLWISGKGTGDYLWTNRRTVLAQSIVKNKWDIFGFQEANGTIQNELPTLVGQQGGKYEWWFVGRDSQDGVSGEALGIAYNPERFELTDKHFFWISPTPDEMSYGWDELGYHRIAACAMVTDKLYNKQFFMMVTHAPLGATARIDYIYSRGDVELKSYKVDNTVYGNIYPSDHCPLTIQFDTDYEKPAPDVVEGSGTAADPWQLNSVSDWNTVAASINRQAEDAVYTSSAYYRLTADIDFDNKNLTPIGFAADNTIYFEGEFDGAGHKLLNVKLVAPGKSCGVFGANKGTIRDLAVEGALSTEFEIAGGIVGINAGVIDGATFKGDITGGEGAKTIGGIAGQNKGTLVNCANLGGTMKTDAPKDPNMGGIVGQIAKGGDGLGRYVINCYSRVDRLEAKHNDVGGIAGIVSDDSFVINCYSTVEKITANSSYASVVGYSKKGNLQNIYGNSACPSKSAANSAVGSDKAAGTVWKKTTFALLSLDEMKSGAVPSSGESCANFAAALNAGAALFNDTPAETLPGKPDVVLRKWTASESYPVLEK